MKKRYTALYWGEFVIPIVFFLAMIIFEFVFYFRLINGGEKVAASTPIELFPIILFLGGIAFVVAYMMWRFIDFTDDGVSYRDLKNRYFIPWKDVKYVKITLNSNGHIGFGSYIVIATSPYVLVYTDFKASRDGFIVLKYRTSLLGLIKKYYDGEIIRSVKE